MFIHNVTVKVDHSIADAWLQWMQQEHIPEMMASGCFTHFQIVQLLEQDDSDGPTYAVQYHAANLQMYERYNHEFADRLRRKATERWGARMIAFRSLMRVVQ